MKTEGILIISLILAVAGCTSTRTKLAECSQGHDQYAPISITYVTMGDEMPSGEWVWQRTDIVIHENGVVRSATLRNGVISEVCALRMTSQAVSELLVATRLKLADIPSEVGRLATDSDNGEIRLRLGNDVREVRFEGAHRGMEEFASIYEVVDLLIARTKG